MKKPRKKRKPNEQTNGADDSTRQGRGGENAEINSSLQESTADLFSPSIEADFVLGDYLDDVITKAPRKSPHSTEEPDITSFAAEDDSDLSIGDISDSAIDAFLKKYLPVLRAEVDDLMLSKNNPQAPGAADEESLTQTTGLLPNDDALFPETLASPAIHLKKGDDEPPIKIEPESPLEILYEINKSNADETVLGESFYGALHTDDLPPQSDEAIPPESIAGEPETSDEESTPVEIFEKSEIADQPIGDDSETQSEESFESVFGLPAVAEKTTTLFESTPPPQAITPVENLQEETPEQVEENQESAAVEAISVNEKAKRLSRAISLYRDQLYDEVIFELKDLLKIDPQFHLAYKILGNAYFKNRMYSDALAAYEQYKKSQPGDLSVHENLGIIYSQLGVLQLALKEWQALLAAQPQRLDIAQRINRANSILHAEPAPPSKPLDEKTRLLNAGIQHYKNKNYEHAIQSFREAAARYADSVEAFSFLGNAYFRNQMLTEAAQTYEKVKQMDSAYLPAYENMAVIYSRQGAHDLALKEWEKVLELNPERTDVHEKIKRTIRKLQSATPYHPTV